MDNDSDISNVSNVDGKDKIDDIFNNINVVDVDEFDDENDDYCDVVENDLYQNNYNNDDITKNKQLNRAGSSVASIKGHSQPFCGGISLKYLLGQDFFGKIVSFMKRKNTSWLFNCFPNICGSRRSKETNKANDEYNDDENEVPKDFSSSESKRQLTMNDVYFLFVKPLIEKKINSDGKLIQSLSLYEHLLLTNPTAVREKADWYVCFSHSGLAVNFFQTLDDTLHQSLATDEDLFVYIDLFCKPRTLTSTASIYSKGSLFPSVSQSINSEITEKPYVWSKQLTSLISSIGKFLVVFDVLPKETPMALSRSSSFAFSAGKTLLVPPHDCHHHVTNKLASKSPLKSESPGINKTKQSPLHRYDKGEDVIRKVKGNGNTTPKVRTIPSHNNHLQTSSSPSSPSFSLNGKLLVHHRNSPKSQSKASIQLENSLAMTWLNADNIQNIPSVFSSRCCLWQMYIASKLLRKKRKDFIFHVALSADKHYDFLSALIQSPRGVLARFQRIISYESATETDREVNEKLLLLMSSISKTPSGTLEIESSILSALRHWALRTAILIVNNINYQETPPRDASQVSSYTSEVSENHFPLINSVPLMKAAAHHRHTDKEVSRLYYAISILYEEEGLSGDALTFLEKAVEEARNAFHNNSSETAYAIHALAEFLRRNKRYADAAKRYQEAVKIWEKITDIQHQAPLAIAKNHWGYCLRNLGQNKEACELFVSSYKIWTRLKERQRKADTSNGITNQKSGKIFDSKHSLFHNEQIILVLTNISNTYAAIGEYEDAIKYCCELIELKMNIHGYNSKENAKLKGSLAQFYYQTSNIEKAQSTFDEAKKIMENVCGKDSKDYDLLLKTWEGFLSSKSSDSNEPISTTNSKSNDDINHENMMPIAANKDKSPRMEFKEEPHQESPSSKNNNKANITDKPRERTSIDCPSPLSKAVVVQ